MQWKRYELIEHSTMGVSSSSQALNKKRKRSGGEEEGGEQTKRRKEDGRRAATADDARAAVEAALSFFPLPSSQGDASSSIAVADAMMEEDNQGE